MQKLEYIHNNAVAAALVNFAEEYKYSSAKFYLCCKNKNGWCNTTHFLLSSKLLFNKTYY